MATMEVVTKSNVYLVASAVIASNTTTAGAILDTAHFDRGLSFYIAASAYTDGTYKLTFTEGDDSGLSDGTTVGSEKIVVVTGTDAVNVGVTAVTAAGGVFFKAGVHSTKRYVRANVVSTAVTTGATIQVVAQMNAENVPV